MSCAQRATALNAEGVTDGIAGDVPRYRPGKHPDYDDGFYEGCRQASRTFAEYDELCAASERANVQSWSA